MMLKKFFSVGAAMLTAGLLATQVQAATYSSPVVCATDPESSSLITDETGTVKLNTNTGKLTGSISRLPANATFDCRITCGNSGSEFTTSNCATSNNLGKITLGVVGALPADTTCGDIKIEVCFAGFGEGGCVEGVGTPGTDINPNTFCQGSGS